MPLTLGDARIRLRDRLDETVGRRWTDPELTRFLNEGANDIARRGETNRRVLSLNGLVDTSEYTTSALATTADILRIHRVEWQPITDTRVRALEYRDLHNMDAVWFDEMDSTTRRQPNYFTLLNYPPDLVIKVWPIPSEAASIRVHVYTTAVPPTTDASPIDLPSGWSDLCIDYAEMRALRKDADPRWKDALGNYEQSLETMLNNTRRYTDQNTVITPEHPNLPTWIYMDAGGY